MPAFGDPYEGTKPITRGDSRRSPPAWLLLAAGCEKHQKVVQQTHLITPFRLQTTGLEA